MLKIDLGRRKVHIGSNGHCYVIQNNLVRRFDEILDFTKEEKERLVMICEILKERNKV
ncbi:MAG: hypothetical protein ACTSPI_02275 [Candidatus Heimdallarchaeaceae archaeon]